MARHKEFCGQCGFETDHDENGCIYHQMTLHDSEGIPYQRYDEFDQDGEAY